MSRTWRLLLVVTASLAAPSAASEEAETPRTPLPTLTPTPTVALICTSEWKPFTSCGKDGSTPSGSHVDIVRRLFSDLKIPAEIICAPWKRCLQGAARGHYAAIFATSHNAKRAKKLLYTKRPLQTVSYSFATLKATPSNWKVTQSLAMLPGPIGSPFGWSITERLLKSAPGLDLDTAAVDDAENMRKLLTGRIKTMVIESTVAEAMIKSQGSQDKITLLSPPYVDGMDYFLALSRAFDFFGRSPQQVADAIDAALAR